MTRSAQQSAYLDALGITEWVLKESALQSAPGAVTSGQDHSTVAGNNVEPVVSEPIEVLDWAGLKARVSDCQLCELHQHRTQAVLGTGNPQADWMIIGEAPGEQEDIQGEPFVGRAGLLLNNMLTAVGLNRDSVYIANIVKCRPPGNRDPHMDEIKTCQGYLQRQIDLIKPDLILAVGRVAAQTLLQSDTPVGKMRGKVHSLAEQNIPVVVTYHPAYLLRKPTEKYKAWDDLRLALEIQKQ